MRSKRAARRRAIRRQIWLCVAILCSAFLIAAGAGGFLRPQKMGAVLPGERDSPPAPGKNWQRRIRISGSFL